MSDNPFASDDWLRLQRQYLETLGAMSQGFAQAGAKPSSSPNPWDLSPYTQAPAAGMPDFYGRLLEQGRRFMEFAAQANRTLAGGEWLEAFKAGSGMFGGKTPADSPWAAPLVMWNQFASAPDPMQVFWRALAPGAEQGGGSGSASMPGLGFFRESQDEVQKLTALGQAYSEAMGEYTKLFNEMGADCVERCQKRLSASEEPISSLRAAYDLWVDCCEEVYGEYVFTDRYVDLHARMVNAFMAWKQQSRKLFDQLLGQLNVPTRHEADTAHEHVQTLLRGQRALQAEIATLREELDALKASARRSPRKSQSKPAVKKSSPKKMKS